MVLTLGDVGERVAHPMHAAALPSGAEDPGDRLLHPFVGIGHDQFHGLQATAHQALEEPRPEGLGLRRANLQADDLAPAIGVDRDGDIAATETIRPPSLCLR